MRYVPSICRSFHWIAVPHCSIDPSRPCASEACLWRLAVVSSMGVFLRMPDAGKGHSVRRQHRQKTASIRLSTPGPLRSPSMILGSCSPLLPSCVGAGTGPPSSRLPSRHANGVPARASFSSPLRARRKRSCWPLGPAIDDRLLFKKPVPARAPAGKGGEPLRCALASCRMPTYDMVFSCRRQTSRRRGQAIFRRRTRRGALRRMRAPQARVPRTAKRGAGRFAQASPSRPGPLRQKPVQERLEKLCCVVDAARRGRLPSMHCQHFEPDRLAVTFRLSRTRDR